MIKKRTHPNESSTEHREDQGVRQPTDRPSGQVRQEQYQRTIEQAVSNQDEQDRDARLRRRAREIWEQEGKPEGLAEQHWDRAKQELDREVSKDTRERIDGPEPDTKTFEADRT
jgi:hypothetical protein